MNALYLTLRYLAAHKGPSLVLACALALTFAIPLGTRVLMKSFEARLEQRAAATPLVVGARGSRFDLVLDALYFRRTGLEPLDAGVLDRLRAAGDDALIVPLDVRHSARGAPLVGTTPDYFDVRGLRPAAGDLPLLLGECALGVSVAQRLGLGPGDTLFTDPTELYDITRPQALELVVSGVLARTDTPDDDAVFCDLRTSWIVDGLLHGHQAISEELDPSLVLGSDEQRVTLNAAFLSLAQVDPAELAAFHLHAERDELPISALLVFPADAKTGTLMRHRIEGQGTERAVRPSEVTAELLQLVLRLRATLDALALALGGGTLVLAGLVLALANAQRREEIASLGWIGASGGLVRWLQAAPALAVLAAALLGALAAALGLSLLGLDPTRWL